MVTITVDVDKVTHRKYKTKLVRQGLTITKDLTDHIDEIVGKKKEIEKDG
jgi:hypothetical protein